MKQTFKGSFKTAVDLTLIAQENGGKLPDEICVLPYGIWQTVPYGEIRVDENVFNQMIANFNSKVRKAVPIDVDHDGGKAAGWITGLINKGQEGLWAIADWTKYGKELLEDRLYRLFSPEWAFDYVDPEYSTHHGAVLVAGSLTNRPVFKELPLLIANDGTESKDKDLTKGNKNMLLLSSEGNTMNKADILKKPVAERSTEENDFLSKVTDFSTEEQAQLDAEKKTAEEAEAKAKADKEAADAKAKEEAEAKAKEEEAAKTAAEKEDLGACVASLIKTGKSEEEAKTAAEKMIADVKAAKENVSIKASELAELKKAAEANKQAQEALRRVATEKEVGTFIANDKGGKILPKSKDAMVDFIMSCSEPQKAAFLEIVKGLPEIKITGQKGDDTHEGLTAKEKVDNLVADKVKAGTKADKAISQVFSENPALAKQYNDELKSK
jgi:hypothetical protein